MKICIVDMPSYTYAKKSCKLLKARGFPCEIKRSDKGCGYSVAVKTSCREAAAVLNSFSVPYKRAADTEAENDHKL